MNDEEKTRTESDSMGEIEVPAYACWGAQTQRAVENFDISPLRIPESLIYALGLIKRCAAEVNGDLGLIGRREADAIVKAAAEVMEGGWNNHFPIDVFQTGSGTSWNMNANEVIANRANELLGSPRGTRSPVHPNDHVNRGQSSNDVVPSAIHIANRLLCSPLSSALEHLEDILDKKSAEFSDIVKLGRTHLQDAVPMTLGQEFSAFSRQIINAEERLHSIYRRLEELALGGTAVGTGLNTHPEFSRRICLKISEACDVPFRPAGNRFEAIAARDAQLELMGILNTLASALMKIANDLRLLASGPRAGFGEIVLPSLQPGSSIMPGKVNPVVPEAVIQAAAHVNGKAAAVTIAAQNGPLQLNMMNPLIAFETCSSLSILTNACRSLAGDCIAGIQADEERCRHWIEWSLALVTPLAVEIGYDEAARLAYKAYREHRPIKEVVQEEGILSSGRIDELLDPNNMI